MRRSLAALTLIALALAACGSAGAPASSAGGGAVYGPIDSLTTLSGQSKPADGIARTVVGAPAAIPAPAAADKAGATAQNGVPVPQAFDPERNLILTANVSMRAADPWTISDKAQAIAIGLGGDVMGLSQSGAGDQRNAVLTLRVPSDRFNDALRQLRGLDAEVISSTVNGQDVTEQFVDLKARLAASQSEEQRYLALLARANTIDEILKIDQTLANVRTRIEQLQGAINSISSRTRFSTITVTVATVPPVAKPVEPAPVTGWDPGKTVDRALAALGAIARVAVDLAIWTLFLGWIPLLALAGFGLAMRARSGPSPAERVHQP